MSNKFIKWDPSWGFNKKIYYLGSKGTSHLPFWRREAHLYCDDKKIFSLDGEARLCAGNFLNSYYFGSLSYDSYNPLDPEEEPAYDQSIFACNKDWDLITELRPSKNLSSKNKYFSNLKTDKYHVSFRDPAPMNNSKLAVCTGGFRWKTKGNVCEVSFIDNKFKITRETILEDNLRKYSEIERCTFWNEFIFFSVQEKYPTIKVGKINKYGMYSYYGEVKNSEMLYGPCINSELQLLYWYKRLLKINNPKEQNLFYEKGEWKLKSSHKRKFFFYKIKDTKISMPLKSKIKKIFS